MYTDPLGIVQQHFYRDIIKCIIISSIFLWFESTDAQSKGVLKKMAAIFYFSSSFVILRPWTWPLTLFRHLSPWLLFIPKKYMLQKIQS